MVFVYSQVAFFGFCFLRYNEDVGVLCFEIFKYLNFIYMPLKKKDGLYYPSGSSKKSANISQRSIYKRAKMNPIGFWSKQAKELKWSKKWTRAFVHNPPKFEWFSGGKINITENCLDTKLETKKNKVAFIWEPEPVNENPRTFTYGQLYKEVNEFSSSLKKLGVKKGDKVGIYMPMVPEAIIAMLSCARIGAVHTVVFSAFSPQALKIRLQDTEAKILITADGYYRRGKVIDLKKNADVAIKNTKIIKTVVVKRAGNKVKINKKKDFWWHELIKENRDVIVPPMPMDSEDLLFILYTSGSTGKPKGTCHVCGGYTVQAKTTGKYIFDWKDNDVFWSTADLGWVTGHTYSCYSPLLNGATFILYEGSPDFPDKDRWAQIIEKYEVSVFYTAPTAVRMFEKYGTDLVRKYKFNSLRLLGSVGEPIDMSAWQWYFKEIGKGRCLILDTWWQTETGGILITSLPGIGPFRPTHTGLPFPGIRVDILDEKGKSQKKGKEGSLVIKPPFSPGLLRGVYKNPKKYLKTYWTEYGKKIYFTSDSAVQDKHGLIRIVGRLDDVIKIAGHRVTTGELESAISLLPDIVESAVIGRPDEIKGETAIAFVVPKNAKKPKKQIQNEVVKQVRKEIGPIASPKEVYIVSDLPKTRSGKIMRRILKKLFSGEELGDLSTLANPKSVEIIKKIIEQQK